MIPMYSPKPSIPMKSRFLSSIVVPICAGLLLSPLACGGGGDQPRDRVSSDLLLRQRTDHTRFLPTALSGKRTDKTVFQFTLNQGVWASRPMLAV